MNIVALTDYINNIGGAELSARRIIKGLADHDHINKVIVIGVDRPNNERLDFGQAKVNAIELPAAVEQLPDYAIDLVIERILSQRARKYLDDADVVHAHHRRSTLALTHLPDDVPSVSTIRDYWPICPISVYSVDSKQCEGCEKCLDDCVAYQGWTGLKGSLAKPYLLTKRQHNRVAFQATDGAVFIADHLRETVMETIKGSKNTEIIYNPVEIETDVESSGKPDSPTFVTASSLVREKGVDLAIEALGKLTEHYQNASLQVFGDGPLRDDLEELAKETCPSGTVIFEGRVPPAEVYERISSATATIFPSRWNEPFGRVTVESLVLGTPVVGSNAGGIAEVVANGKTGLLFKSGDVDSLTDCLRKIHEEDRFQEGVEAWNESERDQFTAESVADKYVNLFRSL